MARIVPLPAPDVPTSSAVLENSIADRIAALQAQLNQIELSILELVTSTADDQNQVQSAVRRDLENRRNFIDEARGKAIIDLLSAQTARRTDLRDLSDQTFWQRLVFSSVTSIGAVLLAAFMIQILLSFFKYFVRLRNYYMAKVVVIRSLGGGDDSALTDVLRTTTPELIQFGKEPDAPIDKVIALLQASKL